MATVKTNIWNLEAGDVISFTNGIGEKRESKVTRVTEKSWYSPNRQSWGTLQGYTGYKDFQILKNGEPNEEPTPFPIHPEAIKETLSPEQIESDYPNFDAVYQEIKNSYAYASGRFYKNCYPTEGDAHIMIRDILVYINSEIFETCSIVVSILYGQVQELQPIDYNHFDISSAWELVTELKSLVLDIEYENNFAKRAQKITKFEKLTRGYLRDAIKKEFSK